MFQVESFYYTMYGDPLQPLYHRYADNIKLPYPKVGTPNPRIKIFVKDLNDTTVLAQEVLPPETFLDSFAEDYIYFRAYWITHDKFGVVWMNRVQEPML